MRLKILSSGLYRRQTFKAALGAGFVFFFCLAQAGREIPFVVDEAKKISIRYRHTVSEMSYYNIVPIGTLFVAPKSGSKKYWFLKAYDCDKEQMRQFNLFKIVEMCSVVNSPTSASTTIPMFGTMPAGSPSSGNSGNSGDTTTSNNDTLDVDFNF